MKDLEALARDLQSEVTALRDRVGALEATPVVKSIEAGFAPEAAAVINRAKAQDKTKKLCPKCGKVPGYFFHVKSCKG